MPGKFIVIEGTDGTGKGTQFRKALETLRQQGNEILATDFPRYGKPGAYFVERYLNGAYGSSREVHPHVASLFYALDRYDEAETMRQWLAAGKTILSNRYTTSSLGHQAGKAATVEERESIVSYIETLEYRELGIPKPDLVILLWMHPFVAHQLISSKGERDYLRGKSHDIHESDVTHLEKAAESYLWMAGRDKTWVVIDCMRPGIREPGLLDPARPPSEKVRTIEEIHAEVMVAINALLRRPAP